MSIKIQSKRFSCLIGMCLLFSWAANVSAKESDVRESSSWWNPLSWEYALFSPDPAPLMLYVAEAFVNVRSGPGWGYPVFHVFEKKDKVELISRKTDWIKVKGPQEIEGWIAVADIEIMQNEQGIDITLDEPKIDDFSTHLWEAGLLAGNFDKSAVNAAYLGRWLTDNISLELWASQVLGDASESKLVSFNIVHQVFPSWRFSPFFTLGAGKIFIEPKSTLSNESKRDEDILNAGLGVRFYLSNRYFMRFEFKDYKLFTNRENNEEASEWKLGLSVFF